MIRINKINSLIGKKEKKCHIKNDLNLNYKLNGKKGFNSPEINNNKLSKQLFQKKIIHRKNTNSRMEIKNNFMNEERNFFSKEQSFMIFQNVKRNKSLVINNNQNMPNLVNIVFLNQEKKPKIVNKKVKRFSKNNIPQPQRNSSNLATNPSHNHQFHEIKSISSRNSTTNYLQENIDFNSGYSIIKIKYDKENYPNYQNMNNDKINKYHPISEYYNDIGEIEKDFIKEASFNNYDASQYI